MENGGFPSASRFGFVEAQLKTKTPVIDLKRLDPDVLEHEVSLHSQDKESDIRTREEQLERTFVYKLAMDFNEKPPLTCDFLIDGKYKMMQCIGSGGFGNVFKAHDTQEDKMLAIKVIKTKRMKTDAFKEVRVMNLLYQIDSDNSKSFAVHMQRAFFLHNHVFLVYDLMGPNISKVLKFNQGNGLPIDQVRIVTRQLICAIQFLHQNNLIHHDIKPDNIAFTSLLFGKSRRNGRLEMRNLNIRLLDYGSTTMTSEGSGPTANSRQYSSPEVTFFAKWNTATDVWSAGCTMFEIFSGTRLFPCKSDTEKCYLLDVIFGPIPQEYGKAARLSCFDNEGRMKYDNESLTFQPKTKTSPFKVLSLSFQKCYEDYVFFELLTEMLAFKPSQRIKSNDILRHPFWTITIPDSGDAS